jgi:hypothetical protein
MARSGVVAVTARAPASGRLAVVAGLALAGPQPGLIQAGDGQHRHEGDQPAKRQPAQHRRVVVVQDQLGWFDRGRAEVDRADEHRTAAGDQRPEAGADPAGPVRS